MFTSRKVKRLQEQLQAVTDENTALHGSNQSLQKQRDALVKENNDLRKQIRDLCSEYNEALEAKETERRELCDQLGAEQQENRHAHAEIERLKNRLSRKDAVRDEKGHFIKKDK